MNVCQAGVAARSPPSDGSGGGTICFRCPPRRRRARPTRIWTQKEGRALPSAEGTRAFELHERAQGPSFLRVRGASRKYFPVTRGLVVPEAGWVRSKQSDGRELLADGGRDLGRGRRVRFAARSTMARLHRPRSSSRPAASISFEGPQHITHLNQVGTCGRCAREQ